MCIRDSSADGGETFTEFKVSQSAFTPTSSIFFGDYTNIAALNGKVYPMWMRMDGTTLSVWIAIIQDTISNQVTANLSTNEGWNLISVPLQLSNKRINKIFPNASSYAYSFDELYYILDSANVGKGFWLKFPSAQTHSLTGTQVSSLQIPLKSGWNLIGGLNGNISISTITTNPPGILSSAFYEYNGGYQEANLISKGKGYWIKSNSNGTLNLSISSLKTNNNKLVSFENFDCIEVSDTKNFTKLYLSKELFDMNLYELPPKPPSGIFDVRFLDDRKVGLYSNKNIIAIENANFPLRIKFSSKIGVSIKLKSIYTQEVFELKNNQEILITSKNSTQFEVISTVVSEKSFLSQNFPNPFNSSTTINFMVPQDDEKFSLTLKVFDLLGQEIIVIPTKDYKPGFYSTEFTPDNFNLSSGIYFYELTQFGKNTGRVYRETKKLNYLK
ncbi:MAG: T9SS type A sorting domain-containing protein, partial [Ignavibacteria bacterium]|nr:T9SS type A sorting domain-containing protein [Ignavibacteria bacterium]